MNYLKTENCVVCGKKAILWHGTVIGFCEKTLAERKIIAGFCRKHDNYFNETSSYGTYDNEKMGKCLPL